MDSNFSGMHQQVYIIEASTNMVDWQMIGVAQDQGDGTFNFDDAQSTQLPARYYRVVVPEDRTSPDRLTGMVLPLRDVLEIFSGSFLEVIRLTNNSARFFPPACARAGRGQVRAVILEGTEAADETARSDVAPPAASKATMPALPIFPTN